MQTSAQEVIGRMTPSKVRALLDLASDAVIANDPRMIQVVEQANSMVRAAVRAVYTLPPRCPDIPMVTGIATDIAIFWLYKWNPAKLSDRDRDSYEASLAQLEMIRKSELDLPLVSKRESNYIAAPGLSTMNDDGHALFGSEVYRYWGGA